ncbi:MAG TPA: trypsin-like serine protease [Kofleriaceae bacterium]|nr:trypsin-like serine protease [Kofleriaceae bacterium]
MKRVVACLLLAAGCDVTTGQQTHAIVGGQLDPDDLSIVAVVARRTQCNQPSVGIQCTATVIGEQVALTAAHCVTQDAAGTLEVYIGAHVGDPGGRFLLVDDVMRHPAFDDETHAYDIALLHLAERTIVPPVDLPLARLDDSSVGARTRVVGYGVTQAGVLADGQRRETTMLVSAVDAHTFTATPDPGNSCGGDSGGPVFVATPTGEQLLGVTSAGDPLCATRAVATRVDVALDFIRTYVLSPPLIAPATIDPAETCTAMCSTSAECPAAMVCDLGRCHLAGALPASYHDTCTQDADCDGTCAQLSPNECRCAIACSMVGGPGSPGDDDTCNASGRSSWLVLLALAFMVRRSRRRTAV